MATSTEQTNAPSVSAPQVVRPGEQVRVNGDKSPIVIQLEPRPSNLWDFAQYAPAIPGVVVALIGLLIAHWLTLARDRRKELRDLCNALKTDADDAANAAMKAWSLGPGPERIEAIHDTKRKLQTVGIMATNLARRTKGRGQIDLAQEVAELRRASTIDPFEDPERGPDTCQIGAIMATLAELLKEIEEGFSRNYK